MYCLCGLDQNIVRVSCLIVSFEVRGESDRMEDRGEKVERRDIERQREEVETEEVARNKKPRVGQRKTD